MIPRTWRLKLFNWLGAGYITVEQDECNQPMGKYAPITLREDHSIDLDDPIRFKVQAVQGGTIVETSWRDHKTDNIDRKMHIITPDQDLSESIGKIVSMELLRR